MSGLEKSGKSTPPDNETRSRFISLSVSSHSSRSLIVKASELPLVGNVAPDFGDEAVFNQEFVNARDYLSKLGDLSQTQIFARIENIKGLTHFDEILQEAYSVILSGGNLSIDLPSEKSKYEMSMMGELNYFLGLQMSQWKDGVFICQSKYIKELLKKYNMEDSTPGKDSNANSL
ncbi:hypothetical protein AgCh_037387 [Apium graveolens]